MTKQNLIKRFFARFMRARAAAAAPAFFFAAAAAGFALAPLDASAASISGDVDGGIYGSDTDQSLAVGKGNITIGGDASVDVTETTLLTGTQLTISSTSETLDFGNVTFQQPVASDSITVSGDDVSVVFDKVAAGAGYGKIEVADGAKLVINGDANLSAITAENGTLTVKETGTATVETLTAKDGATVTLEAADASGVNSLVMAGGTVNVKNFTLDNVDGTNEDNNNASGTISSSGTLTVNTGTTLTTEALNLDAQEGAVIDLKNGSEIDLGTGTVTLGANAQLNIGDAEGAADLTAASLTADETATTTLNGGTLTLNGAGITQNLDSLAESSTGTVSVSGEGATAVFSADKTFENASGEVLDIAVANGTLQVDAAVSTRGTVSAKNLTVGGAGSSVKASAFELSPEGTLTMRGGTLDLSATNGEPTDIYAISEGSSGTITEGDTAGTIALNRTSTGLGELNFTAESGTVALTGTAEAPITVETAGDVNARNLVVGANTLVGANVTVGNATERTGDGLTLNGGTLTGKTNVTVNKVVEENLSGTVDGGTVIFDLDQKEDGTVVAGTLNLGSEETSTGKVWIRGEGLTLGADSVVTATGDVVHANNGAATGLVVGGAEGPATVFDLSATGTKLNVNAVNVYSADELKLSGDQKIGIDETDGKIWLGVAATGEAAGKISTTGTLTSLGETRMNGGRIESSASIPAPAPEQPEEGVFYPEATIHLGDVAMGNGVISAVNGSVKVAAVSDQGIIAAKDISVASVSDDDTDKVILAGSEDGTTAADKLTFTGTAASNISANADSVVNTKALELADGVNVTIGSSTTANILNEENLASVALGKGASLNTTSEDLSALTSVALATGTADDRTTWTHSSGITVNGDVSVGNDASITAAGAVSVDGSVSVGNHADITADSIDFGGAELKIGGTATLTSETGDVTLGGVDGLDDGVLATATVNSAANIVFAADSESSLHLNAAGDIVVDEDVSVTLSQGEIDAGNTTLGDGSTFELLGNNNVLGVPTGTPEENPYELSEVTLGNDATLVIGGNNPADETEFYETFAKADSVKNASADAVGTIVVNGKLAADETTEDKVSVFTAGTVGDATNGGVNVTLNDGGELVATGAGIYAAALNGTGGKLTAQAADGTKNDIYVTASNTVGEKIVFTADELRVTDLDVSDGADVAVRLENADLSGVNSLVVADAGTSDPAATHTTLKLAGTSSVAAVTVGKDGNNGTLVVESLTEGEEPAAPVVVVIGDLAAEGETANFQTGSLTLDGGALVAADGSIDVRRALVAGTNGTLDGTLEAKDVRVDLSAQTAEFGADLTLKGETVTLDGNVGSGFTLGAVVEAGKLVIGSDAEGETTEVIVAGPATTLDGVANEIAVENGDSLFVTSDWTPTQDSLTVTLDTNASLGVVGALAVGENKSFAVNAAEDEEGNIANPAGAVFDEIVNNGNFSLGNVVANTSSWTDAEGATLTITGTKTDTEERLASLDISGAAGGTTTFNSTVSLTNGALAVAQGNVVLNGAVVSENGTVDVEAGDLTANDTVSLTDSTVTASGNVVLNGEVSSENGAITATTGSMTVSGGAGTIKSLGLTAGADITFDTNEFNAEGAVTVSADEGAGNVTFGTNVSLGEGSSVAADTLTVNVGAAGTINGTVDVETIALAGESAPDAGDAASLTISGEYDSASTFTTLTDAKGTKLSLTKGAALKQNGDATASVSLNGTLSVADANSAFSTPGSLTLADTAELTLANGAAANIDETLDLSASTKGAVRVDGTGTDSDATTTLTAGTLVINPADAEDDMTRGVVSLRNGGQFTVGELADGSTVTLTAQNGSGNIWVDETSHFTLKTGDLAITESTRGEIIAESGSVTFGHDADGNGVYELAGIGTQGLDLSVNSGHKEVSFTMSESLNADESKTYSKVDVRGMMNLQGTDVTATGSEDQKFAVSVASGVNLDNANLTLENVAFSGGKSVSLTGSSELSATNTTIGGFDAIITTVGANNSSIKLNGATLNTDVTMNSGTLNVGAAGAEIGAGHTVSVNENVSASLAGSLTGEGKLALNGGNVSLTGDDVTLGNVDVNAANAKISGGETLTIGGLEIGKGDALTVDAALSASGAWNINGGSLTAGTLTIADGADVTLTNSKLNGDIEFAAGADAELSLTESTVAGNVTLNGADNTLFVTDSAIEGTLAAEAGEIHFGGENSFGGLDLTGDVDVFGTIAVKGKLEVDGGFNLNESSNLSTTEGLFVNGGTANLAGTVTQGDVTLTGTDEGSTLSGTIETNLTLDNAQLSSSGKVNGSTTLANDSALTQTGGTLGAVSVSDSTFTQEAAGTAGAVTLTNGASATLAGTVASLDATSASANVSGTVSGDMTLTNATAEVSGKVNGDTTLANGSALTQTGGTLGAVSADASTFTQDAGTAGAVTLTNGASATLAGTVASLDATNATANVSGTVEGAVSLDASTLNAQGDKTFASLSLKNDSALVSTDDITVTGAITDASGSISGANIALNGLAGSASVSASGDLTLGGTTATSGSLTAKNGTLTVAEGGTLTTTDALIEAGTLAVEKDATLNLTIEDDALDVGTLSIDGTANLTAANALTLSNLRGAGTANKTGAGMLTLSGNDAFTGALNIRAGDASLSGAFGGSIGFASESGTITGADGAAVAGTLTLAQGTTLEIGDASGAANLTVGKIALADATARAAGTAKVVHDVFADGADTLTVTDATANLSGLTAVVRSNIDEEILGVGGQTITLVEGDVAAGYGFIEGIGFDRTNAVLSEDGKSLQVMLNWKAAADGLAGSLFNDNQRAVAAATKGWDASTNKYAQALSTLSTTETAAALDDLGALHTVAMMPGQIDGTWNHQKSVLNAIGTGSQMGYQFGKPDVNMGAWVQYVGSYNDIDSSSDRLGWDRTMNGATAGFEYAVSENFLAGVALGYEYAELKSDGNKIEDDAFSVDFFAKHRSGDFEQRAALTFAHHGYDTNRTIAFGGVAESVSGDTDGFTAAIAYEAAYNFAVKEYLTLAPVATLRAALNTIDGWSESGSDAALKFDDQSAFTALAGIGGRAEFTFANPSYPQEALRLSAYALFTAEFGDRSSDVDASFVRGGNAFTMTYDDPEPYALQLGLTAFAPLTNRTALFGGISTELRDEESGFNANIGVRIGW